IIYRRFERSIERLSETMVSRLVDTIQTKEGAVALNFENMRSSRSTRRGKTKNIPSPHALTLRLKTIGKKVGDGVAEVYHNVSRESSTFFAFFAKDNASKNKYPDHILLVDKTRVILDNDPDYYHASWVDGCSQERQYVLAQAPFDSSTTSDFFRMVLQTKPEAIVVLMKIESVGDGKLLPSEGKSKSYGTMTVKNDGPKKVDNCDAYNITVSSGKVEHRAIMFALNSWTDDLKIPSDFVDFHRAVRKEIKEKPREGSQMIVCPSGAHRAGVWAVFDTEAERLKTKSRIRFSDTVKNVRYQRWNTFDHFELFIGTIHLLSAYAKNFA
uniref:Tyrosine-protein phosphatase domain-containing protein n=1 Tax=Parascaris univalens TaxID=6257 RepID=A0A915AQB9_PARUN